jgi:bifunctional UDP-N-acetylglucosamine pyrophosphorylase/glucosamine-1-phosphate N-acetyltransferase
MIARHANMAPFEPLPPSVIVLAAGKGTRMRSSRPKVLHEVGHRALLHHVLAVAAELKVRETIVVVGPDMEDVEQAARGFAPEVKIAQQARQLGTGDAVRAALPLIAAGHGDILVLFGDTPLIRPKTIKAMQEAKASGAAVIVLGFRPEDPASYGRLITKGAAAPLVLERIVEFADATADERSSSLCNSGIFLIDGIEIGSLLSDVKNDNAKGEYYLTDIVSLAARRGLRVLALEAEPDEVLGVNSRTDLAAAEAAFQARARARAMEEGSSLIAPDTVFFAADTGVGRDVVIGPHVVFGLGVTLGDEVFIDAFCHLAGTRVARGARVGPFARLRPGTEIGEGAHIGNFVEIKKAVIESGAKINHLSYIGDARVGAKANIGAGTITCNYDGIAKYETVIEAGAFIGSNSALVAPVTIGEGAYVGSGSVITKDVPKDALAIARGQQTVHEGWAARFRERDKRDVKNKKSKE